MAGLDVRRHQVDLPLKAPVSVSVVPLRAALAFLIFHREPRVFVWAKSLCLTLEFLRVVCSPALTQSSRSHPTSDIKETAGAACTLQCRPTSLVGERRRKNPTARVADSSREKICRPPFPPHNPFMTFSVPMAAHTGVGRLHTPGASLSKFVLRTRAAVANVYYCFYSITDRILARLNCDDRLCRAYWPRPSPSL
jgi:hypothetical protein